MKIVAAKLENLDERDEGREINRNCLQMKCQLNCIFFNAISNIISNVEADIKKNGKNRMLPREKLALEKREKAIFSSLIQNIGIV